MDSGWKSPESTLYVGNLNSSHYTKSEAILELQPHYTKSEAILKLQRTFFLSSPCRFSPLVGGLPHNLFLQQFFICLSFTWITRDCRITNLQIARNHDLLLFYPTSTRLRIKNVLKIIRSSKIIGTWKLEMRNFETNTGLFIIL